MPGGSEILIKIVLFLPLLGSLAQALFGKRIIERFGVKEGRRISGALAVLAVAIPFIAGLILTAQTASKGVEAQSQIVTLFPWIELQGLSVPFELIIDPLSLTMVLIITGVGALIHLYATGYMGEEREYTRFFTYLNLFISAMLILVLGNNLALMFIGWEGVGLCSYLLIGFWYKDIANARAANKAFIVNRIGDWGLTLGIFLWMTFFVANLDKLTLAPGETRFLSYDVLLPNAVSLLIGNPGIATAIALLLFVGACGKSAQFPLYFWLPDAMAGPTPVSALIHAATMVTSGVVMLNRLHVVFELSPTASAIVAATGAFTALFAAVIAFGQTDIKKVLAYSTVSQLGFMFIGCGAGGYWSGMFHVTTHAFFKALLFLGSGAVIYAMVHNQDLRNYGNLRKYLPITFATMFVGYIAIAAYSIPGVFGFAGYYSKEAILGYALSNDHAMVGDVNLGYYAGYLGLFVAALTACYMTRMTWLTFMGKEERWRLLPSPHAGHEPSPAPHAHLHDAHGQAHDDPHGFFLAHVEHEEHEHHHELDAQHTPKEVPVSMWLPLAVLAVLSVIGGWALHRNDVFEHWLYPTGLTYLEELNHHPKGFNLELVSFAAAVAGLLIGLILYRKGLPASEGFDLKKWAPWRRAAAEQFGYDNALVQSSTTGGGEVATAIWRYFDAGLVDGIVNGVGVAAKRVGEVFRAFQTGYVRGYALMMLFGTVGILGYIVYAMTRTGGAH